MLPNTGGQTCFALSGRKQEIKPLQALVKRLGGKLCKDSHAWSHQTTHLVTAGQLRRTEKFFAAAAAGR
jgi:topoisomerase (DNA) II binding protein 1